MAVKPADGAVDGSKHILKDSDGAHVVWVWSGTSWRLVGGAKDNSPDEMAAGGWSYDRALATPDAAATSS